MGAGGSTPSVMASSDGSDRLGMGGRFVVSAVAAVDVADRNRRELFGREIERGHGDGVERAAERVEVAPRVRADAAGAAERERQVGLELIGRRPAVLGHTGAVEQAKALRPFREREPRARLRCAPSRSTNSYSGSI